jgi:hypothetical protein
LQKIELAVCNQPVVGPLQPNLKHEPIVRQRTKRISAVVSPEN